MLAFPFQVFRLLSEKLCDQGNYIYKTNTINLLGYKVWFSNKSEASRQKIQKCVENRLVDSMKIMICCKSTSRRLTSIISALFYDLCSDKVSIQCLIFRYLIRPDLQDFIFKIIESLRVCNGQSSVKINLRLRKAKQSRSISKLHLIKPRQFDMQTSMKNIHQFICGESSDEIWEDMFRFDMDSDEGVPNHVMKFGIAASVFRKPVCCLL